MTVLREEDLRARILRRSGDRTDIEDMCFLLHLPSLFIAVCVSVV